MIIEIQRAGAHVSAMGHRVPLNQGGEPELRRRCYETLCRYDFPPAEVSFVPAAAPGSKAPTIAPPAPAPPANDAKAEPPGKNPSPEQKKPSGPGVASIKPPTVAKAKDRSKGR